MAEQAAIAVVSRKIWIHDINRNNRLGFESRVRSAAMMQQLLTGRIRLV